MEARHIVIATAFLGMVVLHVVMVRPVAAQVAPPCDNSYGASGDLQKTKAAMLSGTEQEIAVAVNNAKESRGNLVGCTNVSYAYRTPDFVEPTLAEVAAVWETIHRPQISAYSIDCPLRGRDAATVAFGGYLARIAGYDANVTVLADMGLMFEAQQHTEANVLVHALTPGAFGALNVATTDFCYIPGEPSEIVKALCETAPVACVTYDLGLFAGSQFAVADYYSNADIDPVHEPWQGGLAFDHAWIGVMMIHAAFQQTDPILRNLFRESALRAGRWAMAEPAVPSSNYPAKNVWLLAELYGVTGDVRYRDSLLEKLERGFKLAILMDLDHDGLVDGMANQPFTGLTVEAQTPGRPWDGHNARAPYVAIIGWAFLEAYVALRDRGDLIEAEAIKPYAVAALDNLAWEINNLGVPALSMNAQKVWFSQPLLMGLWKLADFEGEPYPEWKRAAWAIWNDGVADFYGRGTINAAMYLLYKSGTAYVPGPLR